MQPFKSRLIEAKNQRFSKGWGHSEGVFWGWHGTVDLTHSHLVNISCIDDEGEDIYGK